MFDTLFLIISLRFCLQFLLKLLYLKLVMLWHVCIWYFLIWFDFWVEHFDLDWYETFGLFDWLLRTSGWSAVDDFLQLKFSLIIEWLFDICELKLFLLILDVYVSDDAPASLRHDDFGRLRRLLISHAVVVLDIVYERIGCPEIFHFYPVSRLRRFCTHFQWFWKTDCFRRCFFSWSMFSVVSICDKTPVESRMVHWRAAQLFWIFRSFLVICGTVCAIS